MHRRRGVREESRPLGRGHAGHVLEVLDQDRDARLRTRQRAPRHGGVNGLGFAIRGLGPNRNDRVDRRV